LRLVTVLAPNSICARKLAEKLEPKPFKELEYYEEGDSDSEDGALPGAPRRPINLVIAARNFKLCDKLKLLPGVLVRDICGLFLKGPLEVFIVVTPLLVQTEGIAPVPRLRMSHAHRLPVSAPSPLFIAPASTSSGSLLSSQRFASPAALSPL
jgi:hypothetical protein